MEFFTSDTHWYHNNIIKYSKRPFASVEEMNKEMILRWNRKVSKNDAVYHLGDFAFATEDQILHILSQLNGCIHLVFGNHDQTIKKSQQIKSRFNTVRDYQEIWVPDETAPGGKQHIVLSHFPMISWNKMARGSWMLHGHCHGNLNYPFDGGYGKICDVGTDCWDYEPVSYLEMRAVMNAHQIQTFDHH